MCAGSEAATGQSRISRFRAAWLGRSSQVAEYWKRIVEVERSNGCKQTVCDGSFDAPLAQGAPPDVLEAAFNGVLELDPANAQARHNMQVLMRNTGRWIEGVIDPFAPGGTA